MSINDFKYDDSTIDILRMLFFNSDENLENSLTIKINLQFRLNPRAF